MQCTFCSRLASLHLQQLLPSHDELVQYLEPNETELNRQYRLGTWEELQSRECAFCQLAVIAIIENSQDEPVDPKQEINALIYSNEAAIRLSYPSTLGTQITFVADEHSVRSPENGRIIDLSQPPSVTIRRWLQRCDAEHRFCSHMKPDNAADQDSRDPQFGFNEEVTSNFRVLDLKKGCVKKASLGVRYVTLSYVWGHIPTFRLKRSNIDLLLKPGGLDAIRGDLPKTIRETIDFVISLGEDYLWIDALCLMQDDTQDMICGVDMMNSIYQGSYLTIVAGGGVDANAGLLGKEREPRQVVRELRPGLQMAIVHSIDWHLSRSVYQQRGWTLQELVLPRRTVIFIHGQLHFRCQEANWNEQTWSDAFSKWTDDDDNNISRIPEWFEGRMPSLWAYQKLCEDFSGRKLRSDGDALRALYGILRPLFAGMKTLGVEGLPGYYLDNFLLFISSTGDMRRRTEFASFSWAGWEGKIMWPRENYIRYEDGDEVWSTDNLIPWFQRNSLVQWNCLADGSSRETLTVHRYRRPSKIMDFMMQHPKVFSNEQIGSSDENIWHMSWYCTGNGIHGDCIDWDGPINGSETDQRYFHQKALEMTNGEDEFQRMIANMTDPGAAVALWNFLAARQYTQNRLQVREDRKPDIPRYPRIDMEETHAEYRPPRPTQDEERLKQDRRTQNGLLVHELMLEKMEKMESVRRVHPGYRSGQFMMPKFPPYPILDFGTISLHLSLGARPDWDQQRKELAKTVAVRFERIQGIPVHSRSGELVGSLHPDNTDQLGPEGDEVELIIVARCQTPTVRSALLEPSLTGSPGPAKGPWSLLWVLHIVWIDGIAERRGVGQVLESALHDTVGPKPARKIIMLG